MTGRRPKRPSRWKPSMVTGRKINMNVRELKSIEAVVSRKQARRGVMQLVENRWNRCELAVAGQKDKQPGARTHNSQPPPDNLPFSVRGRCAAARRPCGGQRWGCGRR